MPERPPASNRQPQGAQTRIGEVVNPAFGGNVDIALVSIRGLGIQIAEYPGSGTLKKHQRVRVQTQNSEAGTWRVLNVVSSVGERDDSQDCISGGTLDMAPANIALITWSKTDSVATGWQSFLQHADTGGHTVTMFNFSELPIAHTDYDVVVSVHMHTAGGEAAGLAFRAMVDDGVPLLMTECGRATAEFADLAADGFDSAWTSFFIDDASHCVTQFAPPGAITMQQASTANRRADTMAGTPIITIQSSDDIAVSALEAGDLDLAANPVGARVLVTPLRQIWTTHGADARAVMSYMIGWLNGEPPFVPIQETPTTQLDATEIAYTPGTPADWAAPLPTTQQEFNDRVAAAVAAEHGPIA